MGARRPYGKIPYPMEPAPIKPTSGHGGEGFSTRSSVEFRSRPSQPLGPRRKVRRPCKREAARKEAPVILDDRPYTLDRIVRLGITAVLAAAGLWLLVYLSDVLLPCAVAFLLAYLLNPIVGRVEKRVKSRVAAVILTFLGSFLLLGLVSVLVLPAIVSEFVRLADLLKTFATDGDAAKAAAAWVPEGLVEALKERIAQGQIVELLQRKDFWALASPVLKRVLPGIWNLLSGTTSVMISLLGLSVVALYLFFFLLDFDRAKEELLDLLPDPAQVPVVKFLRDFDGAMSRYFRGQAIIAGAVGIMFAVGFSIIGTPMGIVLGLMIGLLNMVPYLQLLGIFPVGFLTVLQALESGSSVGMALFLMALVFVVIQTIQDALLVPRIMGKATGLSPAMILLSISVWGKLLGFLGLVIALPMTALLHAYWNQLKEEWSR